MMLSRRSLLISVSINSTVVDYLLRFALQQFGTWFYRAICVDDSKLQLKPVKPFVVVNRSPMKEASDIDASLDRIVRNVETCS